MAEYGLWTPAIWSSKGNHPNVWFDENVHGGWYEFNEAGTMVYVHGVIRTTDIVYVPHATEDPSSCMVQFSLPYRAMNFPGCSSGALLSYMEGIIPPWPNYTGNFLAAVKSNEDYVVLTRQRDVSGYNDTIPVTSLIRASGPSVIEIVYDAFYRVAPEE